MQCFSRNLSEKMRENLGLLVEEEEEEEEVGEAQSKRKKVLGNSGLRFPPDSDPNKKGCRREEWQFCK